MTKKAKTLGRVLTAEGFKDAELSKTTKTDSESQTLIILQFSPAKKLRGWRKIFGRVVVRSNGEILINPGILGPWVGLCALIDGVAVSVQGQPLLVPVSWAIHEYPQHAKTLKALVARLGRGGC